MLPAEKPTTPVNSRPRSSDKPLDNGLVPALVALALDDGPADVPVQGDEFTVDGKRGLDLRRPDARFQVFEQLAVADRNISGAFRPRDRFSLSRRFRLPIRHNPAPPGFGGWRRRVPAPRQSARRMKSSSEHTQHEWGGHDGLTEYKAAQSPWIVGILFYYLIRLNNCSHLDWSDHSLWSSHLPQRVREEEKPLRRCTSDSIPDQATFSWHPSFSAGSGMGGSPHVRPTLDLLAPSA